MFLWIHMPLVCTCVFHHGKSIYPGLKDDIQLATEIFAIICLISVMYVTECSDFVTLDLLQSNLMEYWHSYQIWCAEQLFHINFIIKIICNSNISYFFIRLSTVAEVLWYFTYWLQQGDPDLLHYDVTQRVEQLSLWNHIKIVVHIKRIHYWFG